MTARHSDESRIFQNSLLLSRKKIVIANGSVGIAVEVIRNDLKGLAEHLLNITIARKGQRLVPRSWTLRRRLMVTMSKLAEE